MSLLTISSNLLNGIPPSRLILLEKFIRVNQSRPSCWLCIPLVQSVTTTSHTPVHGSQIAILLDLKAMFDLSDRTVCGCSFALKNSTQKCTSHLHLLCSNSWSRVCAYSHRLLVYMFLMSTRRSFCCTLLSKAMLRRWSDMVIPWYGASPWHRYPTKWSY